MPPHSTEGRRVAVAGEQLIRIWGWEAYITCICSVLECVYKQEKQQNPLNTESKHFRDRQTFTQLLLYINNQDDLLPDDVGGVHKHPILIFWNNLWSDGDYNAVSNGFFLVTATSFQNVDRFPWEHFGCCPDILWQRNIHHQGRNNLHRLWEWRKPLHWKTNVFTPCKSVKHSVFKLKGFVKSN